MDHLLPAAPWLMAAAAVVSAAATAALWRAVPWQGRQASLIMAAAMLALAATDGRNPLVGLVLGAVLLVSAMVGTMGVRGTAAAASCCHRALVSLVMAMCAFDGVVAADPVGGGASASVSSGHGGHGLSGVLSVLVLVGVVGGRAVDGRRGVVRRPRASRSHGASAHGRVVGDGCRRRCHVPRILSGALRRPRPGARTPTRRPRRRPQPRSSSPPS
ncbi:hypothetical protein JM654_14760 [Microbacterium oxydans]|nr:hypothetical protein [Microbacterium oxydans]